MSGGRLWSQSRGQRANVTRAKREKGRQISSPWASVVVRGIRYFQGVPEQFTAQPQRAATADVGRGNVDAEARTK